MQRTQGGSADAIPSRCACRATHKQVTAEPAWLRAFSIGVDSLSRERLRKEEHLGVRFLPPLVLPGSPIGSLVASPRRPEAKRLGDVFVFLRVYRSTSLGVQPLHFPSSDLYMQVGVSASGQLNRSWFRHALRGTATHRHPPLTACIHIPLPVVFLPSHLHLSTSACLQSFISRFTALCVCPYLHPSVYLPFHLSRSVCICLSIFRCLHRTFFCCLVIGGSFCYAFLWSSSQLLPGFSVRP